MAEIGRWLDTAAGDDELAWLCRGLSLGLALDDGAERHALLLSSSPRRLAAEELGDADIALAASSSVWSRVLEPVPEPGFHSFGAWTRHDVGIRVEVLPLVQAQALAALERLVELARPELEATVVPEAARNPASVLARRRTLTAGQDGACLIHWLESGRGIPLVFLHTAGADARQFLHQLADTELQGKYRMLAFDLPCHGQSAGVDARESQGHYRLSERVYRSWCEAFVEQVVGEAVVMCGCSMGAAMALTLTARRPDLVRGCIALEAPLRAPGRTSEMLADARVANALHNPAYVRALLSPLSPKRYRDEACAIYAQARAGVYLEDLRYYSDEYDGAALGEGLARCGRPVELLTGCYDYSASPANTRRLHAAIGAERVRFTEMAGLGHFPMIENPDLFRPYLRDALERVAPAEASR